MLAIDSLVERVKSYHPNAELDLIRRAYDYAEWAHRDQQRKSGDPYFIHPVSVAELIAGLKLDTASVCAGLLHDVVEDTEVTLPQVQERFGDEIADLVDGLTKLNKINFTSKEDRAAESFRKMVVAMSKDLRVILVKLCDRLDNMRSLEFMQSDSQERIARETLEIYAPLANRLGMNQVKSELEDLSTKYLDPKFYADIEAKLSETRRERERYIVGVTKSIMGLLGQMGFAAQVSGRVKHVTSILRKMKSHNCEFNQVHDLLAFRIGVETVSECYAALGVIHSKWTPVPGRFKDYIALPKPNRYQSLHTTVLGPGRQRIEVQIRTHEMHRVAEQGVAAHWEYKERESGIKPEDAAKYSWLRELAAFQRDLKDPAEFLESVKMDLFPDEVYVFTPKGDVRVFPRGATPIDFAYGIHSEMGDHISGARANGQIVPIRYRLRNGDLVEIITSPSKQPSKDWLDYVATTRARNRIRGYLRAEHRVKSENLGKELLESEMHRAGMSLTRFFKDEAAVLQLCKTFRLTSKAELLLAIGFGKIQPEAVVQAVAGVRADGGDEPPNSDAFRTGTLEKFVRKVQGKDQGGIRVNGVDDVLIRYAKCCNAIPGDPIIGFITRGRGVTIHRRGCEKAFDTDPERRIDVTWAPNAKVDRPVSVRIVTQNNPGILALVSQTFSAQKLNISEANCRSNDDGTASNIFTFQATDVRQVRTVLNALGKVRGVVLVERA